MIDGQRKLQIFLLFVFKYLYRCIVSKTLNSKWSIELHKLSSRDNFSFLNFQLANDFTSDKNDWLIRDKRNDIYCKICCGKLTCFWLHQGGASRVRKLQIQKLIESEWWTRNMGRSCFAHLRKRIIESLPVNYNNSSFIQSGYENLIARS